MGGVWTRGTNSSVVLHIHVICSGVAVICLHVIRETCNRSNRWSLAAIVALSHIRSKGKVCHYLPYGILTVYTAIYRIVGNFRGAIFSWISWFEACARKFYP